jgi:hypothetical protein
VGPFLRITFYTIIMNKCYIRKYIAIHQQDPDLNGITLIRTFYLFVYLFGTVDCKENELKRSPVECFLSI